MQSPVFSSPAHWTGAAAVAIAGLLLAAAAGADVLVLRDGSRIETQGKWEQKGRQLVFTTAAGTLATLRASEVDLAASEKATTDAAAPKEPEVTAKVEKKPVLVLTDKDVRKAPPEASAEVAAEPGAPPAPAPATGSAGGKVEVVSSRVEGGSGDDAFVVQGSIQNNSPVPVAGLGVLVVATVTRGGENRRVYCEATLEAPLAPKATAEFACPMKQKDVLATGMADAFDEAVLSFEVRSTPQAAPPPDKKQPAQN